MSSNRRASFPASALRRSPRRRTKTPSVNELSKKCKISPRGKRRLEFQQQQQKEPLKGCTFYLDLENYRKASSLKARIKELGGAVEEFLSKDISCVITNKKEADSRCSPRSNSTPSPILSIPSPFPGNTKSSSAKGSAVPSPLSADSYGTEQTGPAVPKHDMRGKALAAQAAITYKYGTSNVIANARNWGLQIVSLEKMLEKLEQYGSIVKKAPSKPLVTGRVAKQGVKPKVRKLHSPFIKVEDHSRAYKPLVHELKEWPKIYFDGPLGSCPFDSPKKDLEHDHDHGEHARAKRKTAQEDRNNKKGFCECCCVHYEDLDMHLHSDRHQSFARDSSNYRSLDELIKKGPSLQDFLERMLLKHQQKEKEKNRSEMPGSHDSVADRDEEKTPSKQNNEEMLPEYQTPPDQALKENEGYHTPINPSPERRSCRTSTTESTPEKKSTDDDTPTRVLRSRGGKISREFRSSPRLSESKTRSPSKVVATHEGAEVRKRRFNSEKTRDKASTEGVSNARTRSLSFSPVSSQSKRCKSASSPSQEVTSHQSPEDRSSGDKRKSAVQNVAKKHGDARTLWPQQESSGASSGKENQEPASSDFHSDRVDESNVMRSRLRSGQQHSDENRVENENQVKSKPDSQDESTRGGQMKSPKGNSVTPVMKVNNNEGCTVSKKDCVESHEVSVKEQSQHDIQVEIPKQTCLRSSTNTNLPGSCSENKNCGEAYVQEKGKRNIPEGSPKTKGHRSASKEKFSKHCSKNEHFVGPRVVVIQEECQKEVHMESSKETRDISVVELNHSKRVKEDPVKTRDADAQENSVQDIQMESPKRSCLRSATKETHAELCSEKEDVKASGANVPKESRFDIQMESSKRSGLRSATKENRAELSNSKEGVKSCETNVQEEAEHDIELESPKRSRLRSAAKEHLAELCNIQQDGFDSHETNAQEKNHMGSPTRSCLLSVARKKRAAKQPFDKSETKKETKEFEKIVADKEENMETAVNDGVRWTRSRVQSAPTSTAQPSNDTDVKERARNTSALESQGQRAEARTVDRRAGSRVRPISSVGSDPQRKSVAWVNRSGGVTELKDENESSQSSKRSFRGSEDVPKVEVKLSDCRKLCMIRKRPVLEKNSDESDTESIQFSSGETLSKGSPAKNIFSEDDENDISSTPTLEYCPSPTSSEKSGYSNETTSGSRRYTLRRHTEQDDFGSSLCKRTRSKYKIPDDSRTGDQGDRQRRKTIYTAYTSVKSKPRSPKQRSQSVQSPQTRTPKKKVKGKRGTQSLGNNTRQENTPELKDPTSESGLSTFSGSPRSGPIREDQSTHSTAVSSVVRNLQDGAEDETEVARDASLLSDANLSMGDVSETAVCGSPACLESTYHSHTGKHSGIKLLEGSPRINKDFHSAVFLAKHRKQRVRVTRLFESDDEEDDFYGFDVPQFDGSFSSEGDLSYKINSIVESMNGDTDQATLEDVQVNITIKEARTAEEETEVRDDAGREMEAVIEESKTGRKEENEEGDLDKDVEIKRMGAARITRKRKSTSSVESAAKKIQRSNLCESQRELRSTKESSLVDCNNEGNAGDFDEDDDVFSTVADSTDGEDDDDDVEVASPFSITSWTRKLNSKERQAEVSEEEEEEVASSFTAMNWRRKRKSEDIQPEVERASKRRKSNQGIEVDPSFQSSRSDTPVKSGAHHGLRSARENNNGEGSSFSSKLDELCHSKKEEPSFPEVERPMKRRKSNEGVGVDCSFQSSRSDTPVKSGANQGLRSPREKIDEEGTSFSPKLEEFFYSKKEDLSFPSEAASDELLDEPVYETIEERVILRRILNISRKEYENSQTERKRKDSNKTKETGKVKFPPLKPLKPLKQVSSTQTSQRLRRINSSPSPIPSPLAGPSGKSRRATWIFASPPPAESSFSGRQVTGSTPVSANGSSRHTSRLCRHNKHTEGSMPQKSRQQRDVFAFNE